MASKKSVENIIAEQFVDTISFHGMKTHNLKNIDLEIPKNKLITVTGVSGSGKSSFAFHTLYKEGQFRYIESLSSYLRQFFNLGARPDIEHSQWLSPAIAIEQNKSIGNSRSTVGTLTEIDDYLRLLFAKVWSIYSYGTGFPIKAQTVEHIIDDIKHHFLNKKVYLVQESGTFKESATFEKFVKQNRKRVEKEKWFTRYLVLPQPKEIDQEETKDTTINTKEPIEYFYLEEPNVPDNYFPVRIFGIFDRITVEEAKLGRLKEDIIKILSTEKKFGIYQVDAPVDSDKENPLMLDSQRIGESVIWFTDKNYCPQYNIQYPDFAPHHFSANRAEWACEQCHGMGEVLQVDFDKILDPDADYLDAILPRRDSRLGQNLLKKLAQKYSMDETKKRKDLPERYRHTVIEWDNELIRVWVNGKFYSMTYKGIEDILKDQYNKWMLTVDFQAMLEMRECPSCQWTKLRKESLHVFLTVPETHKKELPKKSEHWHYSRLVDQYDDNLIKYNIAELHSMSIENLVTFLELYQQHTDQPTILVERILTPLMNRAKTITELWLWYLTLSRQVGTLSWGEVQRLRLAKQLGNKLTGIIYVLDEPTIGLDTQEIKKAIKAIRSLQELGNTIVVVEHHDEFIKASDWIVEIGPGAGDFGGDVMFNGEYKDFIKSNTLTAQYITGQKKITCEFEHTPINKHISIKKASKYNLQSIDVDIQLGSFTVLTGWSGAGKTTLMYTTLFRFMQEKQKFVQSFIRLQLLKKWLSRQEILTAPVMQAKEYEHYQNLALQEFYKDVGVETIMGHENIDNVLYVNQSSIGKTPRSCPSTFVGVFDDIRKLFAGTNDAKYLWFNNGHFSFNSAKGACPECKGYGYKKIELQFLPDTYIPCELCKWNRYKPEVLDIKRRGKTISEVLSMYVADALEFFHEMDHIQHQLQLMVDIGLGYLKMGQPAHTLSWGESQRLKLVSHLLKSYRGHTLYFLDEPTVGLHPEDIERLLNVLKKFLNDGATILMIEHDETLLQFADNVIELQQGKLVRKK